MYSTRLSGGVAANIKQVAAVALGVVVGVIGVRALHEHETARTFVGISLAASILNYSAPSAARPLQRRTAIHVTSGRRDFANKAGANEKGRPGKRSPGRQSGENTMCDRVSDRIFLFTFLKKHVNSKSMRVALTGAAVSLCCARRNAAIVQ